MPSEQQPQLNPSDLPGTFSLLGKLAKDALALRNPQVSEQRIRNLLLKTHTVGKVTLNLPNIVAAHQIKRQENLRTSDPLSWLLECLFILAHQHNEDVLFLRGDERQIAIAQYCKKISAFDIPLYTTALLETLAAVEKKNANFAEDLIRKTQEIQSAISHLASSPLPKPPDTNSDTSPAT